MKRSEVESLLPFLLTDHEPTEIFSEVVYPALDEVRNRYKNRKTGIPELLLPLNLVGTILQRVSEDARMPRRNAHILLGVVEGDIHDMGKNIVRDIYRGYGFQVTDLGKNIPLQHFVQEAIDKNPQLIGISTMMSTTVEKVRELTQVLKGQLPQCKVMIGGAFINPNIAKSINADGYAESAATLIEATEAVLGFES